MGRDRDDSSRSRSGSSSRSLTRSRSRSLSRGHGGRSRSSRRDHSRSRSRHRDRRSRSRSNDRESEYLKVYWKPLKEDSRNFEAWTRLLQYVEQLDETKPAREAYDDFLKRYPYCYGYWRKYAEFERRHKHIERCTEVYERGVAAIPLSCDLWLHYITFVRETAQKNEDPVQKVRETYSQAIEACGMEFRSDKLWEDYITWEIGNGETVRAGTLFDQILAVPTLLYSHHFERYQNFVNSYEPDRVVSQEEYNEIFAKLEPDLHKTEQGELFKIEEYVDDASTDRNPDNGDESPRKTLTRRKHCEAALRALRSEIIERRRKVHLRNEQEVSSRWVFEENIKRPYFHVKPLERAQLRNWNAYIDFEIGRDDLRRTIILFERCMIACAMYEEMWIRYARYLDSVGELARARNVYRRAIEIHLPRKPNLHLAYSAFEEKNGDYDKAAGLLADFDRRYPGYGIIALRRIGIERRYASRHSQDETPDFSSVVTRFERLIHDSSTPRRLSTFYALKLARIHAKLRNDRKVAEKVLREALSRDKGSAQLYLALLELAYSAPVLNEKNVLEVFDEILHCEQMGNEEKLLFSKRKLDFLEDLGMNVEALQDHLEYHSQLKRTIESTGTKRPPEGKIAGETSDKRARTAPIASYNSPQQAQNYYTATSIPENGATTYAIPTVSQPVANTAGYYYVCQQPTLQPVGQTVVQPAMQPVAVLTGVQPSYPVAQ